MALDSNERVKVESGIYMGNSAGAGNFSTKNVIEDFMKTEYQEGLRNEFNTMDALINRLPKDTISGKLKYKSFALGISDNVRAVGSGTFDRYQLGFDDFYGKGVDTVEAQFDTTKLMATFSITDEAILKGTGDGSLLDVLKDSLDRMEVGLKHTYNRYIYGASNGKIGQLLVGGKLKKVSVTAENETKDIMRDNRGAYHNKFYGSAPTVIEFAFTNSHSLIEGMGCLVQIGTSKRLAGYIWQKDNTQIHSEKVLMIVEKTYTGSSASGSTSWSADNSVTLGFTDESAAASTSAPIVIYSRQLNDAVDKIADEYHGLEDIVVTQNNTIFGVNRAIYKSLNCTAMDLDTDDDGVGNIYVNEEILRDLSDHLALTSPEGTAVSLVCANHRIISAIEKQMYQFKNYNLDSTMGGIQLGGRGDVRFDNFVLVKDKYARDNNMYLLDQQKIGELVRRDFTWITSGEVNGVLQRRPGTEMYEGIMNKYADMYIDAWRCHAVLKHCAVPGAGASWQGFSYDATGRPLNQNPVVTNEVKTGE